MEDPRRRLTTPWWYVRRAIPWVALLGCCAVAAAAAALVHRWPSIAAAMMPAALACCAAACTFVFDEREGAVVTVTPRARWRLCARMCVALVPLALWSLIVLLRPADLPLERPDWWLIGVAVLLLAVGAAGVAARRSQASPGASVSAVVALAVFSPLVVSTFLGWPSPYPVEALTTGARTFWLCVGGAGLAGCVLVLRRA